MKKPFQNTQLMLLDELSAMPKGAYATELQYAIRRDYDGRKLALGTIITSMRRLESLGMIFYTEGIDSSDSARRRYHISDKGIEALSDHLESFKFLTAGTIRIPNSNFAKLAP